MDEFDDIPGDVETGTLDYWKHRARQWQKRCLRAETEKTELIAEVNRLRAALPKIDRIERLVGARNGSLGGSSGRPRGL
jgi:hypothetical protein